MQNKVDSKTVEQVIKKVAEFSRLENIDRKLMREKGDRPESSAEHSWHMAMLAMMIDPYYEYKLDMEKVFKLIVIHDLVEIYAGDIYFYDEKARINKKKNEDNAAMLLYKGWVGSKEFIDLWLEYEDENTQEKIFVHALDKLSPPFIIYNGKSKPPWYKIMNKNNIVRKKRTYMTHSKFLTSLFDRIVSDLDKKGYFNKLKV